MTGYPETMKGDIEDGVPISIVGKVVHAQSFEEDGNELYHLLDAGGEEIELKVWAAETSQYDIETDRWYLFEDAKGDVYRGDQKLGSNRGRMEVHALDEPPEFVDLQATGDQFGELTEGGVLVVDIETISTVPEDQLDLKDSDHVELLCIGVGWAPEIGTPGRSDVLFRGGTSASDEVELLQRFCDYVETHDPDQLVFFKGDFDVTHLRGRADRVDAGTEIRSRVTGLFDTYELVNLDPPGSLEDNADVPKTYWDIYRHSLEPVDWRRDHPQYDGDVNDPEVTNRDVPYFGQRYLHLCDEGGEGCEYRALHELLRHYTTADIDPLFEMMA